MLKIEWFKSGRKKICKEEDYKYGGHVYDSIARKILKSKFDLEVTYLFRGNQRNKIKRGVEFARYLMDNYNLRFKGDIVIRDPFSTAYGPFDKKRKHVILLHHIDVSNAKFQIYNNLFSNMFFKRAKKADCVVVVSDYWKRIMESNGCANVVVIYNSFNIDAFNFEDQELLQFKKRLKIPDKKPIIYLGNSRPEKGYLQACKALKNLDAIFVVTGKSKVDLPIIQEYLSYTDYLKLLNISSIVITMSQFNEGWCRTAHEAMLCGTPVIGSGRGGMRELLENGGQTICPDFNQLRPMVEDLLNDKPKLLSIGETGKKYASQFNMEYFKEKWIDIVSSQISTKRSM